MAYKPYIEGTLSGGSIYKRRYTVDVSETFVAGALVYWDVASENNIKVLATDGILMLGMALESAAEGIASVDGKCLVALFTPDTVIRLKCSSTPTSANMFVATGYGVTMTLGVPTLDLTDTTYHIFTIIDVDDDTAEAICVPVHHSTQLAALQT
jgi:hypothetical protein